MPFIEHLYELRKRLVYIAASVITFSALAYSVNRGVITALLQPAGTQKFIYTSPIGGVDFLFRVCLYVGIALSIPVIVYQFLRYIEPLFRHTSMHFIAVGSVVSGILALLGIAFGYFIGLPTTLHFLLHQFVTKQIQPLLTIQAYMAFVAMYILGSALLFQVPLILLFINRIRPLDPRKLLSLKVERWIILTAFIGGGLMNPNPNLVDQVVIVGPLILAYQVGVGLIWLGQRRLRQPKRLTELLRYDHDRQAIRQVRFDTAQAQPGQQSATLKATPTVIAPSTTTKPIAPTQSPLRSAITDNRPLKYFNDVRPIRAFGQRLPRSAS